MSDNKNKEHVIERGRFKGYKIIMAPSDGIETFGHFANEFLEQVTGCSGSLITDQSSLWDFCRSVQSGPKELQIANTDSDDIDEGLPTRDEAVRRVKEKYGVDIIDIESGNLVSILSRIRGN